MCTWVFKLLTFVVFLLPPLLRRVIACDKFGLFSFLRYTLPKHDEEACTCMTLHEVFLKINLYRVFLVRKKMALWVSLLIWLIFIYFFWKLGDPFPILNRKHGTMIIFCYSND